VRHAEPLGQHDADLAEALVVRLQTRQHQIERLVPDRLGDGARYSERVGCRQRVGLDMDGPVGSTSQRLANDLGRAGRARRADDDLPAVLFLETEGLFERVGVGLVQLEGRVGVANVS
jgi:hypothetical protein